MTLDDDDDWGTRSEAAAAMLGFGEKRAGTAVAPAATTGDSDDAVIAVGLFAVSTDDDSGTTGVVDPASSGWIRCSSVCLSDAGSSGFRDSESLVVRDFFLTRDWRSMTLGRASVFVAVERLEEEGEARSGRGGGAAVAAVVVAVVVLVPALDERREWMCGSCACFSCR